MKTVQAQAVINGAVKLPSAGLLQQLTASHSALTGYGLVNAVNAVQGKSPSAVDPGTVKIAAGGVLIPITLGLIGRKFTPNR